MRPTGMVVGRGAGTGLVAGCLAVLLAGCGEQARLGGGAAELLRDGVELESGTVDGVPLGVPDGARITLLPGGGGGGDPDPAAVSGVAACNHYGTTMTVDGDRVAVSEQGAGRTEMACEPDLMAAEEAYLSALPRVTRSAWDGDRLTLSGDGVELVYAALLPVETSVLVGTPWRLDALVDGETASSTVTGARAATLELRDDGTLTGGTGCRLLGGRYEVVADEVHLLELSVDGDCPADLAAQDEHVVEVLGEGFSAVVEGGTLTVSGSGGTRGLVYLAP